MNASLLETLENAIFSQIWGAELEALAAKSDDELFQDYLTMRSSWLEMERSDCGPEPDVGWRLHGLDDLLKCRVVCVEKHPRILDNEAALRVVIRASLEPHDVAGKCASMLHAIGSEVRKRAWGRSYVNMAAPAPPTAEQAAAALRWTSRPVVDVGLSGGSATRH